MSIKPGPLLPVVRTLLIFSTASCGATTGFSPQLSILNKDDDFQNESGNTFRSDKDFSIEWLNEKNLKVIYDKFSKASYVIDTSKFPLHETVMELTNGKGADAAIDSVGGSSGNELAFCVHPNGNFLTIGLLSGVQVNWAGIVNKAKVNANMFHLRNWNKNVSTDKWQETFNYLIRLVADKKLRLMMVDSQYDLSNVKKAVDVVESSNRAKGKVFLTSY